MDASEKFIPPAFNLELQERPRLVQGVIASIEANAVTCVVAPTGCGKSALLLQVMEAWSARAGRDRCLWYGCDRFDREAWRFVALLARSVTGAAPSAVPGRGAIEALMSANDPKGVADAIVADGRRVVLFLDNFHLCDVEETARALDILIAESRGLLHPVLTSRRAPHLALGQLRMRGLVGEFDAQDLAFTEAEARNFIGHDCRADADAVDKIIGKTEGWAVALQLVRLLSRAGGSLRQLSQDFSGADQDIGQFLNEEVLRSLPDAMRDFLLAVCPLDRISASLAEAVTLKPDAPALFDEMKERNLFVAPLDRGGRQVRLHSMFRQFLITQASRQGEKPLFESLIRAAAWHRERGEWIEAADYAFRAHREELAAHWLEEGAEELLTRQGETARFLSCAERLPAALRARPAIAYWMIWAALFSGAHDRAAGLLAEHEAVLKRQRGYEVQVGLLRFLIAYFAHRHVEAMALGKQWLTLEPAGSAFDRATVAAGLALCHRTQLDMQGARRALELSRQFIAEIASDYGTAWVATLTAQFLLIQGRPAAARDEIQKTLDKSQLGDFMRGSSELVLAEAYYEMDERDQARQLVKRSLSTVAQHGNIDIAFSGWTVAVRLALLDHGPEAALDLLRQVQALGVRRFGTSILRQIQCLREEIVLDLDYEVRRGLEFVVAEGVDGDGAAASPTPEIAETLKLIGAYRSIVSGNPRRAVAEIMPVMAATRSGGRLRRWAMASCIKASAHHAAGDMNFALRALMEAIEVCAPLGLRRCLLDHAAVIRPLAPALAGHVKTIRDSLTPEAAALALRLAGGNPDEGVGGDEAADDRPAVAATLSRKEFKVLIMVSQGMTNHQITERLFVSLPTVKWHLRNIYDKLEVRSRTAAVAKARALGVLQ